MADVPLLARLWECPNCVSSARTVNAARPMHRCAGLAGLLVPLVPQGTNCKMFAVERGDYVGKEMVQTDGNGRPVMSVVTVRDDGQDCCVFAPTALGSRE